MNFLAFKVWRAECLRANPEALDCGETNLYRSLASMQPEPDVSNTSNTIHRCDVARKWLGRYGFSESLSRRALVCRGIRHALNLIFRKLARSGALIWIPGDVYPVYSELALGTGLEWRAFPTLPRPILPRRKNSGRPEFLLLANPWKPLGRFLNGHECERLMDWLDASRNRCLLIDSVYDLGVPFHGTTRALVLSERAILLHSVTKGWLCPKTFGVALFPEARLQWGSDFRSDPPSQEQLALATRLLSDDADMPEKVVAALGNRKDNLVGALPASVSKSILEDRGALAPGCYFFPVNIQADSLLQRHGIIGLPASVFGAKWNGTILTSLAQTFGPLIK
jgi:aspartate/methionine/tyrosine aminotransferase